MRSRQMGRAAAVTAAVTVVCLWLTPSLAQVPNASVSGALDLYARGEFDAAIRTPSVTRLRAGELTAGAEAWIAAGSETERGRRRVVAASFAIDLVWSTTQDPSLNDLIWTDPAVGVKSLKPPDRSASPIYFWAAVGPVVEYSARIMSEAAATPAIESAWWPAALGLLQHGKHWTQALDLVARARTRAPYDRWPLVQTIARTYGDVPPPKTNGRPNVLVDEGIGVAALKHASRAIAAFDELRAGTQLVEVKAEADVRTGYLEVRCRHWAEALVRLDRAAALGADPFLVATANYLAGWAHEQQRHAPAAIAAYRRAHAIVPTMRNLSTLLAAQLFLTDARAEAHVVLDAALNADPAPPDLLLLLERGDARFMPGYLQALRKALK